MEIVERKGLGHPDTICDAIAEAVCKRLCRQYLDRFGVILHHNVDKVLLCGGTARAVFGGGEVHDPIEIYLAGRATRDYRGDQIPIDEIAIDACREWLGTWLPGLDLNRGVRIVSRLRPGSADLTRLFSRKGGMALSNDTSCGCGFAPYSDLERTVLAVEKTLNSAGVRSTHPQIGQDVKVMGVRRRERIELTIGCAFVARFVTSLEDYVRKKEAARELALRAARRTTRLDVEVTVNAADDLERGDVFLTVTGTSAEAGDDGEVGRGNRVSGLITPYRVMTLEAAAGKNPVSHVGKLYNVLASRIAAAITTARPGVTNASVVLVSQIGRPIDDPQIVDIDLGTEHGVDDPVLVTPVLEIVNSEFGRLSTISDDLLSGRISLF